MPELTLEELKAKLHKSNDDFHDAVDEIMSSEHVIVQHKTHVGYLAKGIFDLMGQLNNLMESL